MRLGQTILLVAIFMMTLSGCQRPDGRPQARAEVLFAELDPKGWTRGRNITTQILNHDTLSLCDLRLVVRADRLFDFDSLALTIKAVAPDGSSTLLHPTLINRGSRQRSGMQEWSQPIVVNAQLMQEGEYTFHISHSATRTVRGIWTMGVERSEK